MGQQPITFLRQVSGPSEAEAGEGGNGLGGHLCLLPCAASPSGRGGHQNPMRVPVR